MGRMKMANDQEATPQSVEPMTLKTAAEKVKQKRTAWLEQHGVPISTEFAKFAEAIGELTDLAESRAPQTPPRCPTCGSNDRGMPWCMNPEHAKRVHSIVRYECERCADLWHSAGAVQEDKP
jgi:hypothetical protein